MATDVTAGYIVSDVERLRDPMNKIHLFIAEGVDKGVLDAGEKNKSKIVKAEAKKKKATR